MPRRRTTVTMKRSVRRYNDRAKAKNPRKPTKRPPAGPRSREYFSSRGQNQGTPSYVTKSNTR